MISLNFTQRPSAADLSAASDITNATKPSVPVTYASKYRDRKKSTELWNNIYGTIFPEFTIECEINISVKYDIENRVNLHGISAFPV
jgi:hypothetical protein